MACTASTALAADGDQWSWVPPYRRVEPAYWALLQRRACATNEQQISEISQRSLLLKSYVLGRAGKGQPIMTTAKGPEATDCQCIVSNKTSLQVDKNMEKSATHSRDLRKRQVAAASRPRPGGRKRSESVLLRPIDVCATRPHMPTTTSHSCHIYSVGTTLTYL